MKKLKASSKPYLILYKKRAQTAMQLALAKKLQKTVLPLLFPLNWVPDRTGMGEIPSASVRAFIALTLTVGLIGVMASKKSIQVGLILVQSHY